MKFYQRIQPWCVWAVGAAFFFCEYFARVDPSVMVEKLMVAFKADALSMGHLGAFFYYPYIVMQIPVGLLVDRHGPRRWLVVAAIISSLGSYVFSIATSLWMAECARMLIGFGASFAFVCALKLATVWFDHARMGLLAGLTQGAGMLGAALGEGLFVMIVAWLGWRGTMSFVATVLASFVVWVLLIVRDAPPSSRSPSTTVAATSSAPTLPIWQSLWQVLRLPASWCNALFCGFLYAPTAALGEFWGVTFFHHAYHLSETMAGVMMSAIFVGWAIGGPLAGLLSDRLHNRKRIMMASVIMSFVLINVILFMPTMPAAARMILMLLYGASNSGVALAYAAAGEMHDKRISGIAIAFTNMASILVGALLQPLMGWLLQTCWQASVVNGVTVYPDQAYLHVMWILPVLLLVSFSFLLCMRDTYQGAEHE